MGFHKLDKYFTRKSMHGQVNHTKTETKGIKLRNFFRKTSFYMSMIYGVFFSRFSRKVCENIAD
jgi:hypothetical protein